VLEPGEEPRNNIWYVVSSPTSEIRPTKRSGHQLTSSGHLIGGATPDGFAKDSYLKLDTYSHDWTSQKLAEFEVIEHYASETPDGRLVVLASGSDDGAIKISNTDGKFENQKWKSLSGQLPVPRTSHESCTITSDGKLVVFSGGNQGAVVDSNLYEYDIGKDSWRRIKCSGPRIPGRQGHSMSSIGSNKVTIFAGMAEMGQFFSDLWELNLSSARAKQLKPVGATPQARASHAAAGSEEKGLFYIHGGITMNSGMPQVLEDLWQFDSTQGTWTELTKSSEVALPTPRLSHSMAIMKFPVYKSTTSASSTAPATSEPQPTLIELDNWRSVTETETTGEPEESTTSVPKSPSAPTPQQNIETHVDVLAIFGGMDLVGNFFDDLMIYPI